MDRTKLIERIVTSARDGSGIWSTPEPHRGGSGRVDRGAADEAFAARQAEVEAEPESWQAWYRLALAYDDAGDRARARSAVRRAISLYDERRTAL